MTIWEMRQLNKKACPDEPYVASGLSRANKTILSLPPQNLYEEERESFNGDEWRN